MINENMLYAFIKCFDITKNFYKHLSESDDLDFLFLSKFEEIKNNFDKEDFIYDEAQIRKVITMDDVLFLKQIIQNDKSIVQTDHNMSAFFLESTIEIIETIFGIYNLLKLFNDNKIVRKNFDLSTELPENEFMMNNYFAVKIYDFMTGNFNNQKDFDKLLDFFHCYKQDVPNDKKNTILVYQNYLEKISFEPHVIHSFAKYNSYDNFYYHFFEGTDNALSRSFYYKMFYVAYKLYKSIFSMIFIYHPDVFMSLNYNTTHSFEYMFDVLTVIGHSDYCL